MTRVSGFPPVLGTRPRVLILGSMPGVRSLEQQQYYAHPRNAYWRIMGDLFGVGPELPYAERLVALTDRGIALWDVLATCDRTGSLDSNIADATARPNDFTALFAGNPSLRFVFFNGRKAASAFRRGVAPALCKAAGGMTDDWVYRTLPSTSPAHASRTYDQKLREWAVVREALESAE